MDISHKSIDIVFRDNNLLDDFRWQDNNATLDETLEKALHAFSIVTALWIPDSWDVEFSGFNLDVPTSETKQVQIPTEFSQPDFNQADKRIRQEIASFSESKQSWFLRSIQTSLHGWNRLMLPISVKASDDWQLVDTDNRLRSTYVQHPAAQYEGLESVWLKVSEMNPATHFSLVVEAAGDISLRTSLGISFFNPANDGRDTEELIREAKLKNWQKANQLLYHSVIASLQAIGWTRNIR